MASDIDKAFEELYARMAPPESGKAYRALPYVTASDLARTFQPGEAELPELKECQNLKSDLKI